jgi:hypothetical protein
VAFGQDLSKYFGFPCQFSFHQLLRFFHLSSETGTVAHLQLKYQHNNHSNNDDDDNNNNSNLHI